MVNYNNGKIYKIEPLNGEEGDIYIGSTTKNLLSQRMDKHRGSYKQFLNGNCNLITSFNLFEKYGVNNCNIILLELVNVNSKDELHAREAYYIKMLKCVNKIIPLRTHQQFYEDNKDKIKDKHKQYYEVNKDKIKDKRKQFYEDNKDKMKQYYEVNKDKHKQYYEVNKDKIKDRMKQYYEVNKDKQKQYYEVNKDKIKDRMKQYYEVNKDKK